MINLLSYLSPESIFPLQDLSYTLLLEEAVHRCLSDFDAGVRQKALEEIRRKSRTRSPQDINLGKGFALIHAKLEELDRIYTAVGILPKRKKLLKGERIQTLFCIFLPTSESRHYLSMLARLGRLLQQEEASRTFGEAGRLFAENRPEDARDRVISLVRTFEQG